MAALPPVILMRPGTANAAILDALQSQACRAWDWPAFTITDPDDTAEVERELAELDQTDMVILVSPVAAKSVRKWLDRWPAHLTVAAVGEGTARVIRELWPQTCVLCPPGDSVMSGSEALLSCIEKESLPQCVLICRGQTGREWLADELTSRGVRVKKVACYKRVPLVLGSEQCACLKKALTGPSPVIYLTSSEAVSVLLNAVGSVPGAQEWLKRGCVLTIHPRCEQRLKEAGFQHIILTSADDRAVVESVQTVIREK